MTKQHEIIYNLTNSHYWFFLPNAYAASLNTDGFPTYAEHHVQTDTLTDYIPTPDPIQLKLFRLIDTLRVANLEKRFNSKTRKRKKGLKQLLEDEVLKKQITRFVQQRLDDFLKLITQYKLPLCLELRRKDWIANKQIFWENSTITPNLHFNKKTEGVYYRLNLTEGKKTWSVKNQNLHILTNTPAWFISKDQLYQTEAINGNMLKPFMTKEEVFIKRDFVKTYFQKFIVKVANQTNIYTEGFEVLTYQILTKCELNLVKNFLNNSYGLTLHFHYATSNFSFKDTLQQKTTLEFKGEEVILHQYQRDNKAEQPYLDILEKMGLQNTIGQYFNLDESDPYALYPWLIEQKATLEAVGFMVQNPQLEQKKMTLANHKLKLNAKQINDWFDLYGSIQVGDMVIPFQKLANYIREENRFYPLPNGEYFLIPIEWLERYKATFQFGKVKNNVVRLTKSQFPVIKNLDIQIKNDSTNPLQEDYKETDYEPSKDLKATLRPYQLEGVKWLVHLYQNQLGGCLADDMGLGKTIQTIAILLYAKAQKAERSKDDITENPNSGFQLNFFQNVAEITDSLPLSALIVMPASLIFNWESEIRKFAPNLMVYKHIGTKRHETARYFSTYDVILTTYHTALKDTKLFQKVNFEYIVLDESQQIKNKDSKIFKAINELNAVHRISLSGTPIENSLSDLWSQMQFINPDLLGSFRFFKEEFLNPIEKSNDKIRKKRLRDLTAPYLLRRTKEAVAKDLPPLTEKVFFSEMGSEQRQRYEKAKSRARNFLLENMPRKGDKFNTVVFDTLLRLRQLAIHPKLMDTEDKTPSSKFKDILEHLEVIQKSGHKTLIFSQFVKHLDLYKQHFQKQNQQFAWLTGSTPSSKRGESVRLFEENEAVKHFLISIKAGGTGLNLTAADYVFITDPWWNPAVERQAIARAHRIGQAKNVIAIRFITKDTIEEKIMKLQARKQQLAEDMINYKEQLPFTKDDLIFLVG